jgi:hypothetical protein
VVALNTDESVRALKGAKRPLVPLAERAELIAALRCVDYVTSFGERDLEATLRALRPDVHAKGTDYTRESVPEREIDRELGIEIAICGDPQGSIEHAPRRAPRGRSLVSEPGPPKRYSPLALVLWLGGAFLGTICGVGGGIFATPILHYLVRVPFQTAIGTSLVLVFVMTTVATGMEATRLDGAIDWQVVLLLLTGSIPGAWIGYRVSRRIDTRTLKLCFIAVLLAAAARTWTLAVEVGQRSDRRRDARRGALRLGDRARDRRRVPRADARNRRRHPGDPGAVPDPARHELPRSARVQHGDEHRQRRAVRSRCTSAAARST